MLVLKSPTQRSRSLCSALEHYVVQAIPDLAVNQAIKAITTEMIFGRNTRFVPLTTFSRLPGGS